jgi:hypothetical protein
MSHSRHPAASLRSTSEGQSSVLRRGEAMILILLAVHVFFLFTVFTKIGMLDALICLIFAPYALWLFYREWSLLRGFFFVELALIVAIVVLGS